MVTWEPMPPSVFELLDMLEEVEDTMTCSHLPFCRRISIKNLAID